MKAGIRLKHTQIALHAQANIIAIQQALIFFILGVVILATGGTIMHTPIYKDVLNTNKVCLSIGLAEVIFGIGYFAIIYLHINEARKGFALTAFLVWLALTGFYLASDIHKIGAVISFILAFSAFYEEFCRSTLDRIIADQYIMQTCRMLDTKIKTLEDKKGQNCSPYNSQIPVAIFIIENGLAIPKTWTMSHGR